MSFISWRLGLWIILGEALQIPFSFSNETRNRNSVIGIMSWLEKRLTRPPSRSAEKGQRVREIESANRHFAGLLITLPILVTVAVILCSYKGIPSTAAAKARASHQKVQPKRKAKATARTTTKPETDSFKHDDYHLTKAKLTCSSCHIIRPPKPPDVVATTTATTEVKTYPYHDKCIGCHRVAKPQLFRGTAPVICAVCHTASSPRLTKNDMNPFPKQSVQTILGDLSVKFNHESTYHRHDCTSCHLNVALLDLAKADVPISTCATSQCHRKQNVQPGFETEMLNIDDDDFAGGKNQHACTGCHSTSIGAKLPPCTHLKLYDSTGTSFNSTDFPKSAKLISEKCK